MLIRDLDRAARRHGNSRRVQSFSRQTRKIRKFGRKPLKDLGSAAKISEEIGRELIVFGTIMKA